MSLDTHPEVAGDLAVLGALALASIRQLTGWRLHAIPLRWPALAITLCGIVFTLSRVIHLTTPSVSLEMIRLQYAAGFLLPGFGMASIEGMQEGAALSRGARRAIVAGAVLAVVCAATPWLIDGPVEAHPDLFGHPHYGAHPTLLTIIFLPIAIVLAVIALRRRVRALPRSFVTQRRSLLFGALLFAVAAANDALAGAGVFPSIFVVDYVFVAFGFLSAKFELHRTAAELNAFERELMEREASLAHTLQRLELSNERYRQLSSATREGVVLVSNGQVVDVNDAACRILGHTDADQLRGRALAGLVAPDVSLTALLEHHADPLELPMLRGDGTPVPVSLKAITGTGDSHILLLRDISIERDLQRRLATADRLAAVGTLAAGTAHEINNPLTFVLASAELLHEELPQLVSADRRPEVESMLDDVMTGALRVRDVVRNLMSLARDRGGEATIVDVRQTVTHCIAMANAQLRHRARVVTELGSMRPVRANEGRLSQVFLNLLVNAAHAIPEGHVDQHTIHVRGRTEGELTVVEVEDTGSGIPREVLDRMFEPFFTTKQVGQGTGLGLSISHGIVSDLGGRIEVTSTVGVGSVFRVYLPATDGQPATVSQPQPVAVAAALRILVIDDEVALARGLARILDRHQVDIVNSGRDALEVLAKQTFDVVICDVMMPDITGIQLYETLRAGGNPITDRFLFVTGGVSTVESQRFLDELGPKRWLAKPIPMAEVRARVDRIGRASEARDRLVS